MYTIIVRRQLDTDYYDRHYIFGDADTVLVFNSDARGLVENTRDELNYTIAWKQIKFVCSQWDAYIWLDSRYNNEAEYYQAICEASATF